VRDLVIEQLLAPVFGVEQRTAATADADTAAAAAESTSTETTSAGRAGAGRALSECPSTGGGRTHAAAQAASPSAQAAAAPATHTASLGAPVLPPRVDRRWSIAVEVMRADLLGENGGQPTSIDVVLAADDAVVCVESKYLTDALQGFGGCSQFPVACRGFRGPGSDLETASGAWCRLEQPEGRREARRYWAIGERLFRPQALAPQRPGDKCPLRTPYQLARTLLFAAECARRDERPCFAALVLVPAAAAALVERQAADFVAATLLPEHAGRVAVVHYERLVELLLASGDRRAAGVGSFLAARLPAAPASPPRTETVRDLRRRAESERRAVRRRSD
jgi:hypothetical protein